MAVICCVPCTEMGNRQGTACNTRMYEYASIEMRLGEVVLQLCIQWCTCAVADVEFESFGKQVSSLYRTRQSS
jgi:hypothetical protein